MDKSCSKSKVEPFIRDYDLNIEEFAQQPETFASFNEFFYRKLKTEARPVSEDSIVLPADGRHLAFTNIDEIDGFFVKGQTFDIHQLINDRDFFSIDSLRAFRSQR